MRDDKGKFLPGESGNPAGICKNGDIPQKVTTQLTQADVQDVTLFATQKQDETRRIYLESAPALMTLAIKKAQRDNKLLAILIMPLVQQQQTQSPRRDIPNVNQLRLELEELKNTN